MTLDSLASEPIDAKTCNHYGRWRVTEPLVLDQLIDNYLAEAPQLQTMRAAVATKDAAALLKLLKR